MTDDLCSEGPTGRGPGRRWEGLDAPCTLEDMPLKTSTSVLPEVVRVLIDLCPDPVQVLDERGAVVAANRAAVELAAADPRIQRLGGEGPVPDELGGFWAMLQTSGRALVELDHGARRLSFEGTVVDGLAVVLVRDVTVTDQDAGEQGHRLRQLEAAELLTLTIAHDMNNLLTPILALTSRLVDRRGDPEETRSIAREIHEAAGSAASLTRQLLAFGRGARTRTARVNVGEVVAAMHSFLARLLGDAVELVLSIEDRDAEVLVDPERLEHVLLNLAVNARDAMARGGRVAIRTSTTTDGVDGVPGPFVVLTVADTGHGVLPELRDRIFDPFFTTKAPGRGTGLGLASARQFVHDSRGHVSLQSEPGQGTVVSVYIPCAPPG